MRFINMRDFLRQINKELEDLPFTVTSHGRPVFTVVEFDLDKFYEEKGLTKPIASKDAVEPSAERQQEVPYAHGVDRKSPQTYRDEERTHIGKEGQ